MTQQIAIRIPDELLTAVDAAVERGRHPNRAAAIRALLQTGLATEREWEIADAYRRGYGEHVEEAWVGEAGLELMSERLAELEPGPGARAAQPGSPKRPRPRKSRAKR